MSFKSGVKGGGRDRWWERRWWLWWGHIRRMRWTRRRVNTMRLTEWRRELIPKVRWCICIVLIANHQPLFHMHHLTCGISLVTGVSRQIEYDWLDKNMTDWLLEVDLAIEHDWRRRLVAFVNCDKVLYNGILMATLLSWSGANCLMSDHRCKNVYVKVKTLKKAKVEKLKMFKTLKFECRIV